MSADGIVFDPIADLMASIRAKSRRNTRTSHLSLDHRIFGGKDSTVVTHLVFEHLLSLPPSARTRPVYIVSNDTLVESPLVIAHVEQSPRDSGGCGSLCSTNSGQDYTA